MGDAHLSAPGGGAAEASPRSVASQVNGLLAAGGLYGALHVRALHDGREVKLHADAGVVLASTFKVAIAIELFRQAAEESLDLTSRIVVPAKGRPTGPTGISAMADDVELSLRDAAYSMMALSDNAAADALIAQIGLDRIQATLHALGLRRTVLVGDCAHLWGTIAEDLGFGSAEEMHQAIRGADDERERRRLLRGLAATRALRPSQTSRSTPREMTRLLWAVWREAGLPRQACLAVRALMCHERSRAAGAFGHRARVSAKGGTLAGRVVNEVAVIEFGDGDAYAVALFARVRARRGVPDTSIEDAMARAVYTAVEHLRAGVA